jgi:predicted nucleotidyltransferase
MSPLRALISSKIRRELLRILVLNPDSTFSINGLSIRTEFSLRGVNNELRNLFSGGILRREISGNKHRYQIDPLCPIYREIKEIIRKTVGIPDVVKQALQVVSKELEFAFIYGSFAVGDYGNDSDVDLFFVSNLSGDKLAELLGPLQGEIGRSINIQQYSSAEYKRRKKKNDHFLNRVLEGPKIILFEDRNEFFDL